MEKWLITTMLFFIVSFALWVGWKIFELGLFLMGKGISFLSNNVGIIVIMVVILLFINNKFGNQLLKMKMFNPKKLDGNIRGRLEPTPSYKQIPAIHKNQEDLVLISTNKPQPKSQLVENEQYTQSVLANAAPIEIAKKPIEDDISAVPSLLASLKTDVDHSFLSFVKSLNQQQIKLLVNKIYDGLQMKYNRSIAFGEMGAREFVEAVLLIQFNPDIAQKVIAGIEKVCEDKFTILQFSEFMDAVIDGSDIPYEMWRDTYNYIQNNHGWIKEHPCSCKNK